MQVPPGPQGDRLLGVPPADWPAGERELVVRLARADLVAGRVEDEAGAPMPRLTVFAGHRSEATGAAGGPSAGTGPPPPPAATSVWADADGRFRVKVAAGSRVDLWLTGNAALGGERPNRVPPVRGPGGRRRRRHARRPIGRPAARDRPDAGRAGPVALGGAPCGRVGSSWIRDLRTSGNARRPAPTGRSWSGASPRGRSRSARTPATTSATGSRTPWRAWSPKGQEVTVRLVAWIRVRVQVLAPDGKRVAGAIAPERWPSRGLHAGLPHRRRRPARTSTSGPTSPPSRSPLA